MKSKFSQTSEQYETKYQPFVLAKLKEIAQKYKTKFEALSRKKKLVVVVAAIAIPLVTIYALRGPNDPVIDILTTTSKPKVLTPEEQAKKERNLTIFYISVGVLLVIGTGVSLYFLLRKKGHGLSSAIKIVYPSMHNASEEFIKQISVPVILKKRDKKEDVLPMPNPNTSSRKKNGQKDIGIAPNASPIEGEEWAERMGFDPVLYNEYTKAGLSFREIYQVFKGNFKEQQIDITAIEKEKEENNWIKNTGTREFFNMLRKGDPDISLVDIKTEWEKQTQFVDFIKKKNPSISHDQIQKEWELQKDFFARITKDITYDKWKKLTWGDIKIPWKQQKKFLDQLRKKKPDILLMDDIVKEWNEKQAKQWWFKSAKEMNK